MRYKTLRAIASSNLPLVSLFFLLLLTFVEPANSNIFGDIANGIGHLAGGVAGAIGGLGGAIGGILGAPFGGAIQGATGPAVDYAASRFTAVADHAADRLDQSLQKENTAID